MFAAVLKQEEDRTTATQPGSLIISQCMSCVNHNKEKPFTCAAFPEGIPPIIYFNDFPHVSEYTDGDVTDNGILYTSGAEMFMDSNMDYLELEGAAPEDGKTE